MLSLLKTKYFGYLVKPIPIYKPQIDLCSTIAQQANDHSIDVPNPKAVNRGEGCSQGLIPRRYSERGDLTSLLQVIFFFFFG